MRGAGPAAARGSAAARSWAAARGWAAARWPEPVTQVRKTGAYQGSIRSMCVTAGLGGDGRERGAASGIRGWKRGPGGRRRGGCWSRARPGWPRRHAGKRRYPGTAVADPVDVTGRGEPGHGAGRVLPAGDLDEVLAARAGSEDLLLFGALQNAGDAPRHVVVNGRHLTRPPHHDRDRERAAPFHVNDVGLVTGRVALQLRRAQQVRPGQMMAQRGGHPASGLPGVPTLLPRPRSARWPAPRSGPAPLVRPAPSLWPTARRTAAASPAGHAA